MVTSMYITRNPETSNYDGKVLTFEEINFNDKKESFSQICSSYERKAYLFVDLTNFNTIEILTIFSSLIYAKKVKDCKISKIVFENENIMFHYEIIFKIYNYWHQQNSSPELTDLMNYLTEDFYRATSYITITSKSPNSNKKYLNTKEIDFNNKIEAFKQICRSYKSGTDLIVSLTNLNVIETLTFFSSLFYATDVENCYVKKIVFENQNITFYYEFIHWILHMEGLKFIRTFNRLR